MATNIFVNYETLFSVIPLEKGIQIKPMRVWIPACAGMTEKRVSLYPRGVLGITFKKYNKKSEGDFWK